MVTLGKYKKTFIIPYYEADKNKKATPLSILAYLGETSGAHTDAIGYNVETLKELNYGWMLNRWRVKIDRYPEVGEKIGIETWSSNIDRFYANREFIIYDDKNIEICRASTVWIFIDMVRKRPIRIPLDFIQAVKPIEQRNFREFYDFKKEVDLEDFIDFRVRRTDIDYNNHVNNIKYLSWMLETIPCHVYENYILKEFEILYKKESIYGNTILSGIHEINNLEDEHHYFHGIIDKDSGENHAMGLTKWEKER